MERLVHLSYRRYRLADRNATCRNRSALGRPPSRQSVARLQLGQASQMVGYGTGRNIKYAPTRAL
jgi:hypothetical protein